MELYSNSYNRSYMFEDRSNKDYPYVHLQGHVYLKTNEIRISLGFKRKPDSSGWFNSWRVTLPADQIPTMDAVKTLIDFPVEYRDYVDQVTQMFLHLKKVYGALND